MQAEKVIFFSENKHFLGDKVLENDNRDILTNNLHSNLLWSTEATRKIVALVHRYNAVVTDAKVKNIKSGRKI